ncbi:MAG: formate dehydrogenase subunit gamma, partial [Gammaproteobacteria bacterium]|nr:formate dehydrogenase subunit gamma [Gammaproteobacteria bacterium]
PARSASIILLLLSLLLPQLSAAAIPQKHEDFPQGVSAVNPGSELWREVRQRDLPVTGISQVKGVETGVLINSHGDQWARFRIENPVKYTPMVLGAVFLVLLLFYVLRGKVGIAGGLSGQMVKRFSETERIVHWTLAIVFLFLAVTGLILLLGRPLLIPLFGKEVFSLLASASKEGHNLFGPIFLVSLLMMLFSFVKRNIYEKGDLTWLLKGGGFIGDGHVSGGFFNMGEKTWYWIVILIGLAISISGLILVSPNFGQGRVVMEISHLVHVFGAIILTAVSIGHMYMGSIGTEGSLEGMKSGYVDINWVEAHHDRWARECRENEQVISAEEFARLQGNKADAAMEKEA